MFYYGILFILSNFNYYFKEVIAQNAHVINGNPWEMKKKIVIVQETKKYYIITLLYYFRIVYATLIDFFFILNV